MPQDLYTKYNQPVPRYTSYPTVPHWNDWQDEAVVWKNLVEEAFEKEQRDGISLYLHLPYCESLCTYCGCNKRITRNHEVERPYIDTLKNEYKKYSGLSTTPIRISEIHLGGGTPTFFSPSLLSHLLQFISLTSHLTDQFELAFEGHPNNTTLEHLQVLYDHGSRRVSLGIQDFDPVVQKAINRIQPFEAVKKVTDQVRTIGYTSLNFDLIYGLPFQSLKSLEQTIAEVIELKPDRIAFYSYAHVPWKAKSQRGYNESDLPDNQDKRSLYELGKAMFMENGYQEIGMDHFALPDDALFKAKDKGKLNRNFMGYTTTQSDLVLGLGVSSISDLGSAYGQNAKVVEDYATRVNEGVFPVNKGIVLTEKDRKARAKIKQLICNEVLDLNGASISKSQNEELEDLRLDGIITIEDGLLKITEEGKPFIRNVCSVFDRYYQNSTKRTYSKSI